MPDFPPQLIWAPTLTSHDPSPPLPLETPPGGIVEGDFTSTGAGAFFGVSSSLTVGDFTADGTGTFLAESTTTIEGDFTADGAGIFSAAGGEGDDWLASGSSLAIFEGDRRRVVRCFNAFTYLPMAGPVWDGTLRRDPEIQIHDTVNDSPNTSSFTDEEEPQLGANVQLDMGDGLGVLAGGVVQSTTMRYEGLETQLAWDADVADYLWLLNKRRPFGCFEDESATDVVLALAAYAPADFSFIGVQAGLPEITVEFDGSLDFSGCLSLICQLIGGGKFNVDKNKVVSLFLDQYVNPPDDIDDDNLDLLRDQPITVHKDISQVRNRVFVKGASARLMADADVGGGVAYVGGQVGGRAGAVTPLAVDFGLTGGIAVIPATGDLVVITIVVGSTARNPSCAVVTPAGYTPLGQLNASAVTADTSLNVSWKRMGATPDRTFTLPSTGHVADSQVYTVQVFRGVDLSAPLDATPVSATGAGTGRPNPAAILPATPGAWVVLCAGGAATTLAAAYTAPDGFEADFLTGVSTDVMVGSGYWTRWDEGPVDPAAYTGGTTGANDSWAAYTLALRPAPVTSPLAPTQLVVDGVDIFNPLGGQVQVGCQIANYTGVLEILVYPPPDASAYTPPACGANADNTQAGVIKTRVRYSVAFVINGKESQRGPNNHEFTYGNPTGEIIQASPAGMSSFSDIVVTPGAGLVPYGGSEYDLGAADSRGGIMTQGMGIGVGASGPGTPVSIRFEGIGTLGDPRLTQLIFWRRSRIPLEGDPQIGQYLHEAGRIPNGSAEWTDVKSDESLGPLLPPAGVNIGLNTTGSRSYIWGIASGPSGTTARKIYRQEYYGASSEFADDGLWTDPELCMTIDGNDYIGGQLGVIGQVGDAVEDTKPTRAFWWKADVTPSNPLLPPGPPPAPTTRYVLQGVTGLTHTVREGDEVSIWLQVDDLAAQIAMATIEGGDGIHEYLLVDSSLRSTAALLRRGNAELELFKDPIWTVNYSTFDMKSVSGAPVSFNLTHPPIVKDLIIVDVTIDKVHFQGGGIAHRPRYNVTASSVRFTLEDLLRRAVLRT